MFIGCNSVNMREKTIEATLVREVKAAGGLALKLNGTGWAGAPDRLILLPNGRTLFAELKSTGEKPRALQRKRAAQLTALGFKVFTIDNLDDIQALHEDIYE